MEHCVLCNRACDDTYTRAIKFNDQTFDIVYCDDCAPIDIAERRTTRAPYCVMCIMRNQATTTRVDDDARVMQLCDDDARVIDAFRSRHITLTA